MGLGRTVLSNGFAGGQPRERSLSQHAQDAGATVAASGICRAVRKSVTVNDTKLYTFTKGGATSSSAAGLDFPLALSFCLKDIFQHFFCSPGMLEFFQVLYV